MMAKEFGMTILSLLLFATTSFPYWKPDSTAPVAYLSDKTSPSDAAKGEQLPLNCGWYIGFGLAIDNLSGNFDGSSYRVSDNDALLLPKLNSAGNFGASLGYRGRRGAFEIAYKQSFFQALFEQIQSSATLYDLEFNFDYYFNNRSWFQPLLGFGLDIPSVLSIDKGGLNTANVDATTLATGALENVLLTGWGVNIGTGLSACLTKRIAMRALVTYSWEFYNSEDRDSYYQYKEIKDVSGSGYCVGISAMFVFSKPFALEGKRGGEGAQNAETEFGPLNAELDGPDEIRVSNPNPFRTDVEVQCDGKRKIFYVDANSTSSIHVRNGHYDIFFRYSNEPDAQFKGESFTLWNNGIQIQIVQVEGGNYRIQRVK